MPVKKGEGCIRDVMREWKAGALRSGKDGPVVTDREQATAIALSMCGGARSKSAKSYEEAAARVLEEARDFAEDCGCKDKKGTKEYDECNCGCKKCKKRVPMAIGYPTPTFSEDEVVGMVRNRLKVMRGRLFDIGNAIEAAMMLGEGEVKIEQWMIDKITLAADYLSAVADNATYGDGVEVKEEEEERPMAMMSPMDAIPYEEKEEEGLEDACWKGYTAVGLKKKGKRMVPNCVKDPKGKLK
jgi:hypothetical protein